VIPGPAERNQDIHPWLIAPVVAIAAFMEILDISVANVALPHIAGDLSVSQDESTWILTSYLVTNATVMPVSGWLSGRFGRKRFFLTCIIGFSIASLACGLAPSLGALVVLRALQGAAGGGLQPSGQAILTDSFPPEQRSIAISIYGVAAIVAPAIGPTIGGWITDNYEWRWVFLMNVPIGIILALLLAFLVRTPHEEPDPATASRSVDWAGFALVALALGCLQVVLDRGQEDDWFGSRSITALAIMSGIAFVLLIWRELTTDSPMIDVRLFKRRDFAIGFVLMFMFGFMILGTTYLLPAYAQALMGYRATEAGEVLFPGGMLLVVMFPLVGRVLNKVDLRLIIAAGVIACAAAIWWQTNFYLEISFAVLVMARVMQAVGLGLLFIPINALGFRDIPGDRTNYASALINLARNVGGSVGISIASTLVTRRAQFHQDRLVGFLQPLQPGFADFTEHLGRLTHSNPLATAARAYQLLMEQAMLLSYLDAFKAIAVLFMLTLPLLLFVKPGAATGAAGAA
jgi:MFS transporter, DHA2 family, multidrug resistance protein